MIAVLALLLLAQAQPDHPREPVPVPDTARSSASEHGATLGHQEVAPGAHKPEHERGREEHKGGIAEHIFEHVLDETVVPLGFWVGNRYIRLDITKHVINMWLAAGVLLIVVGLAARKRALVPKGGYNLLETLVMFVRDEISVKNIGDHADQYTPYLCSAFFFILFMNLLGLLPIPGPFDEAVLLIVAVPLVLFYREPLADAWKRAAA